MNSITIEDLEALASVMQADEAAERARLQRLISAYCRIAAAASPTIFGRMACQLTDEDGHYDNSFPPSQEYREYSGPRLVEVISHVTEDIATSSGYYHTWRRVTADAGVYLDRDGTIYGCHETGTGALGQFAAHPGTCDVQVTLTWDKRHVGEVSTANLRDTEGHMRAIAFPLVAKARSGANA